MGPFFLPSPWPFGTPLGGTAAGLGAYYITGMKPSMVSTASVQTWLLQMKNKQQNTLDIILLYQTSEV